MTIPDANILLYAHNSDAPQYKAAARRLESLFGGPEVIGFPWATLWAFARIATNPRIWPEPQPPAAIAIESGATLASTDRDFSRFEGLRWVNPLL